MTDKRKYPDRVGGLAAGGKGGNVHPYHRDTTIGTTDSLFPAMHAEDVKLKLSSIFCAVCGIQFGHVIADVEQEGLCSVHAWLYSLGKEKL